MSNRTSLTQVEERFLSELKHHISGWENKVSSDFNNKNVAVELDKLRGDPVYSAFGFDCTEYVAVRLVGRMSISIGRRLGEIYDKIPRFVAAARFALKPEQVAEKFDGLEVDLAIRCSLLNPIDKVEVKNVICKYTDSHFYEGIGIEIRYNFNPNDSARLRKDVQMAESLQSEKLLPVYLVFSDISPRDDAIARLKRAGWTFLVGEEAKTFSVQLLSTDFTSVLQKEEIKTQTHLAIKKLLKSIFDNDLMRQI